MMAMLDVVARLKSLGFDVEHRYNKWRVTFKKEWWGNFEDEELRSLYIGYIS